MRSFCRDGNARRVVNRMHICVYKCCGTVSSPVEHHDCASERIACTPNTRTLYHNLINMQTTENPRPVHWPVVVFACICAAGAVQRILIKVIKRFRTCAPQSIRCRCSFHRCFLCRGISSSTLLVLQSK